MDAENFAQGLVISVDASRLSWGPLEEVGLPVRLWRDSRSSAVCATCSESCRRPHC